MSVVRQLWIWVLALVPFGGAMLFHTVRPPVPLAVDVPRRPALAFDQYLVDLGPVTSAMEIRGTFVFRNRGREVVKITEVVPSCGCLQPRLTNRELAPGEAGMLQLPMQPANEQPGRKEYFVDVCYTDPLPREVRLTFRLELPASQITVQPRALMFYLSGVEPTTQKVVVTDPRQRPARVLDVGADNALVTAEVGERRPLPEGGIETEVQVVVAGRVPEGRNRAVLWIRTDDADVPMLKVPLWIEGTQSGVADVKTP